MGACVSSLDTTEPIQYGEWQEFNGKKYRSVKINDRILKDPHQRQMLLAHYSLYSTK